MDREAIRRDRERLSEQVSSSLARPKVLLGIFAAGLGFGWLRPEAGRSDDAARESGDSSATGRLARTLAAVLAGARLYERARRAAEWVGPPPSARGRLNDSALGPLDDSALDPLDGSALDPLDGSALDPLDESALDPLDGSAHDRLDGSSAARRRTPSDS